MVSSETRSWNELPETLIESKNELVRSELTLYVSALFPALFVPNLNSFVPALLIFFYFSGIRTFPADCF